MLLGCLLSQQTLDDAIKPEVDIFDNNVSFSKIVCTGAACVQHSLSAAVQNSQLPFS